jgi:hypothetical protein
MPRFPLAALPLAALLAATLLAGCAKVEENAGACQSPPPTRAETVPKAPLQEYVQTWQPGHWDWDGRTYTWIDGAWIKRDSQSTQWMGGYWDRPVSPGPCVWVPAHWV